MFNLNNILSFTKLLNKFQDVKRTIYHQGKDTSENDVEHSYQLAMLAWYISDSNSLDLNKSLLIEYALIHDLVEVYAGDTFLYSKNQEDHDSKKEREEDARLRIEKEFPEFKDLHQTILNYEQKLDKESNFVYVLDKIHPVLEIYLDGGRLWKDQGVTLDMLLGKKKAKASLSPELLPYWEELEKILLDNKSRLFPEK